MKIIGLVLIVRQTVIVFQNRIDESIDAANREIDDGLLLPGLATICRDRDRLTERPNICIVFGKEWYNDGDIKLKIMIAKVFGKPHQGVDRNCRSALQKKVYGHYRRNLTPNVHFLTLSSSIFPPSIAYQRNRCSRPDASTVL